MEAAKRPSPCEGARRGTPGGLHTHTHTGRGDPSRRPHLPGRAGPPALLPPLSAGSAPICRAGKRRRRPLSAAPRPAPGRAGLRRKGKENAVHAWGPCRRGAELPQAGLHGVSGRQDLGPPHPCPLAPASVRAGLPPKRGRGSGTAPPPHGEPALAGTPRFSGDVSLRGTPEAGTRPSGTMGAAQGAEASPWGTRRPRSAAGCGRAANGVSAPTALPAPTGGGRAARRDGIPPSAGLSGALRARMGAAAATPQPLSLQNGVRARIPPAAPARASAALAGLRATRPRTDPRSPAPIRAAPAPYGAPGTPSPDRTPSPDPPVPAARSAGAAEPRTENSFPPTRPLPPAHLHRRRRPGRAAPLPPAPSRYIARPAPALRMCEGGRQLPRPAPAPRCPSAAPRPRRPPRPGGHPAVSAARSAPGAAPPRFPP